MKVVSRGTALFVTCGGLLFYAFGKAFHHPGFESSFFRSGPTQWYETQMMGPWPLGLAILASTYLLIDILVARYTRSVGASDDLDVIDGLAKALELSMLPTGSTAYWGTLAPGVGITLETAPEAHALVTLNTVQTAVMFEPANSPDTRGTSGDRVLDSLLRVTGPRRLLAGAMDAKVRRSLSVLATTPDVYWGPPPEDATWILKLRLDQMLDLQVNQREADPAKSTVNMALDLLRTATQAASAFARSPDELEEVTLHRALNEENPDVWVNAAASALELGTDRTPTRDDIASRCLNQTQDFARALGLRWTGQSAELRALSQTTRDPRAVLTHVEHALGSGDWSDEEHRWAVGLLTGPHSQSILELFEAHGTSRQVAALLEAMETSDDDRQQQAMGRALAVIQDRQDPAADGGLVLVAMEDVGGLGLSDEAAGALATHDE